MTSLYRHVRSMVSRMVDGRGEYQRLQDAMSHLLVRNTSSVSSSLLDIGCGAGGYTVNNAGLLSIPLEHVVGVEFNPIHLAQARARFTAVSVDLECDPLPFDAGQFDIVVCNQVLEHIKNIFWLLSEMDRVCAVGGLIAIGVPNLTSLLNRPVLLAGRQPVTIGIEGPHVRGYAHASLSEFLLRHPGYRLDLQLGSSLYPWPARWGAESLARRLPGLSAYVFYALRKTAIVSPCPWLGFGVDAETSYVHASNYVHGSNVNDGEDLAGSQAA